MPKSKQSSSSSVKQDLKEYCKHHKVEVIQYFCRDHNVLACSSCVASDHRTCKNDYIPEASRNYENSQEYKSTLHILKTIDENCTRIALKTEENKMRIVQNQTTIRAEIKKLCQEVRVLIDKWEKDLDRQAADLLDKERTKNDSAVDECYKISSQIKAINEDLKPLQESHKNNELFIRVKKSEMDLQTYTAAVRKMAESNIICDVQFKPNASIRNMLKIEKSLGELVCTQIEESLPEVIEEEKKDSKRKGGLYDSLTATFSGKIDIKMATDKKAYNVTGIAVIVTDQLAVADFINNKIKIVDTKQQKVVGNAKLSSGPWDVALLPGDQLAVTLPDEHKIHVLSTTGGLSQIRQMKVGGYCYGLAYSDEKLVVTLHTFPAKVQVLTMEGEVLRTIKFDEAGKSLFVFPWYVTLSKTNKQVYISDADKKDVKCLDMEGEVKSVYKDSKLSCTYGLVALEDGTIMVCSYNSNTIHLVSSDFNKGRIMIQNKDGIQDPRCLAVDWEQRKLYVGCYQNVNLQVYDLK
ncbi:uncharacterized protein LOC128550374 [Mercenaria mercenaria]|uniref:uncharacterized protein LOC128550374 n=1 Tax=Mercenaria mercenaria TaxID=6596 RepID=UPI00234E4765|nr:uncharacterized protein LOC128550374 [Mercenaria mercenaria]